MKKIVSIEIENFRAFYGAYNKIDLPQGENLLIYGENGSGKSSLFKALNDYLKSSRSSSVSFVCNRHSASSPGKISLEFAEFNPSPYVEVPGTKQVLDFATQNSSNQVQFIQDSALIKGFLEYRNLLDVYLHKESQPNLFELIVLNLLGNFVPVRTGGSFAFQAKWKQLQDDLIENAYTRNDKVHTSALAELPVFERHLRGTLDDIFNELNRMLSTYFSDLHLVLNYDLKPITFDYHTYKWEWETTAELRLLLAKDGVPISGNYGDLLNEARLSAFAICLYLSSLKCNPTLVDLRILYLDDIFIGLDAGNRIPILEIIQNEFSDYQVFISTYDRHWYELAKSFFSIHNLNKWINLELYVGKAIIGSLSFDKPTVIKGASNYDRALQYLHHRSNPDYPAAANYFRRAIEQLIQNYIPKYETVDANSVQIPDHKLSLLLKQAKLFLTKTSNDTTAVADILSLLHALIHPLSHHSINSPIYKNELLKIEKALVRLEQQLRALDIPNNYKCILEHGKRIKLTFCADSALNHFFYYEIILKAPLVIKRNSNGAPDLCGAQCVVDQYYGINGTTPYAKHKVKRKDPRYNYDTLEAAYNSIYSYLVTRVNFPMPVNGFQFACEWDDNLTWSPLVAKIVW